MKPVGEVDVSHLMTTREGFRSEKAILIDGIDMMDAGINGGERE